MNEIETNGVCERCPLKIMLDCAEDEVRGLESDIHNEPLRNLGGIAITRSVLERVASKVNCKQPQDGTNKEPKCPLEEMVMRTRTFAYAPFPQNQFVAKLEDLADKPDKVAEQRSHGQYL